MNVLVLWGGGLGDALVMRPLLHAWHTQGISPLLASVSSHIPGLIESLGLGAQSIGLTPDPFKALTELRRVRPIDLLYISPYSPIKTQLLARLVQPENLWISKPRFEAEFVADVVCNDALKMGLTVELPRAYGPLPIFPDSLPAQIAPDSIVVHPGSRATWRTKRWPTHRWIELLQALRQTSQSPVVVVGTESERDLLDELKSAAPQLEFRSALSLAQLEHCIAQAPLVICTNSGVMHIAVAHRRPTVVVTGSSARFWRPPYPHVFNVTSPSCQLACNQRRCPIPGYNARCIRLIEAHSVMSAVTEAMAASIIRSA